MRSLTHRQYLTWHEWLRNQWNEPNRTDHYLMQLAAILVTYMTKKEVALGKLKIPFEWKFQEGRPMSKAQREKMLNNMAEYRTMAALGVNWEIPNG